MKLFFGLVGVAALALGGCTAPNSGSCLDGTCGDPARPFCDTDGALSGTPGLCVAVDCAANTFKMCRGDDALVCNAEGTNYDVKQCEAGCGPAGCNKVGGCVANTTTCGANDALFMCDPDGMQLAKIQDCQYGCDVDHCNACSPSTTLCSGDDLVTCNAGGEIVNPTTCQFGCQAMACNECKPNTTYCQSSTAVTCTAAGKPGTQQNCGAAGCQAGVCNTCTPSTTTCQGDNLVVCNGGGTVQSVTPCALGCGTAGSAHCNALVPSFGVPAPSGTLPDLRIEDNATLDISNCAALDVKLTIGAATNAVPPSQIASITQASGPPICVVKYGSISIVDPFTLGVTSSASPGHVLSLEGTGDITISGKITFIAQSIGPSPGVSTGVTGTNSGGKYMASGGGGGGGAFAGGNGGKCTLCGGADVAGGIGGAALTYGTVLLTGSKGGSVMMGGTTYGTGGRGGGGLHLVSLTRVTLAASAVINLNGVAGIGPWILAGNLTAGGGGSGGMLAVEAPIVNVSAGAIAAANGGGGAGGGWYSMPDGTGGTAFFHYNGQNGQLSTSRAAGGDIANSSFGDGGYEADGTVSPSANGSPSDTGAATYDGGGGGGSRGYIVLRARTLANVMLTFGAVISPAPVMGTVTAQ